jgi:hypothetical protein
MMRSRRKQCGLAGLLVLLLIIAAGAVFLFTSSSRADTQRAERIAITQAALARAKAALLAYTISRGDISTQDRPGEFPCPTGGSPNPGAPSHASYGDQRPGCAGANLIGRFPWRTIGVPEILDADGEPLWYVVSNDFKSINGAQPTWKTAINSNTRSKLRLSLDLGGTSNVDEVVALVFSPGAPLGGQMRSLVSQVCASNGTTMPADLCAANYLEKLGAANNTDESGPFLSGPQTSSFNDRAAYITTADFIPAIEERIAAHVKKTLSAYYAANGYYPFAALYTEVQYARCGLGVLAGRFPNSIQIAPDPPATICVDVAPWPGTNSPNSFPDWFIQNSWATTISYSVAKQYTKDVVRTTPPCQVAGDCLTVGTDNTVQVVLMFPGVATASQKRPTDTALSAGKDIRNYFEINENLDAWSATNNNIYASGESRQPSRDLVIAIKN